MTDVWIEKTVIHGQYFLAYGITKNYTVAVFIGYCPKNMMPFMGKSYTQYGPIKNGRIKNQGSDFEKK